MQMCVADHGEYVLEARPGTGTLPEGLEIAQMLALHRVIQRVKSVVNFDCVTFLDLTGLIIC